MVGSVRKMQCVGETSACVNVVSVVMESIVIVSRYQTQFNINIESFLPTCIEDLINFYPI